jgi:hypothetical protein
MRLIPSLPPVTTGPDDTRQVGGLTATHAVKPVAPVNQPAANAGQRAAHQVQARPDAPSYQRTETHADRRKICRRVIQQPVLVELRSGIERRRRRTRAGDMIDHIDEQA